MLLVFVKDIPFTSEGCYNKSSENGEIILIAFADFSKAFDTVDFVVLLKKHHAIGFWHSSLNWI